MATIPSPGRLGEPTATTRPRPAAWKNKQKADPTLLLYRPSEVAKMLRCSAWWIKEQARKRRIPFSWIGGSYLFTSDHIAEIVQLFETRPTPHSAPSSAPDSVTQHGNRSTTRPNRPLKARKPRKALKAEQQEVN